MKTTKNKNLIIYKYYQFPSSNPSIILPILPHQPLLLVPLLRILTPSRRLILATLLLLIPFLLRLMHRLRIMFRRTVYRIQDQRRGSRIHKLMLRARWHDYQIPGFDVLVFAVDGGAAEA